jgi:hypothetical protein
MKSTNRLKNPQDDLLYASLTVFETLYFGEFS